MGALGKGYRYIGFCRIGVKMMNNEKYFIGQKILKIDDYYWIVSNVANVIWKCDLSFNVIDYLILEEEALDVDLFRAAVYANGHIYIFPFNGDNAYKINVETKCVRKINIDITGYEKLDRKFSYAFIVNNVIIAVGRKINGFLKYDLKTENSSLINSGWNINDEYICSFTHCVNGGVVYTVSVVDAKVTSFDFEKNAISTYYLPQYCNSNFSTIMGDGEYIYITNDRCEVLKFNNKIQLIGCTNVEGWNDKNIRFSGLKDDICIYVGNTSGDILVESLSKKYIERKKTTLDNNYGYCFTAVEWYDSSFLLQSRSTGNIIIFDLVDESFKEIHIYENEKVMNKFFNELMETVHCRGEIVNEETEINLKRFIDRL